MLLLSFYLFITFITTEQKYFFNILFEKLEIKIMFGSTILLYKLLKNSAKVATCPAAKYYGEPINDP